MEKVKEYYTIIEIFLQAPPNYKRAGENKNAQRNVRSTHFMSIRVDSYLRASTLFR
jgi:hypothetical protein